MPPYSGCYERLNLFEIPRKIRRKASDVRIEPLDKSIKQPPTSGVEIKGRINLVYSTQFSISFELHYFKLNIGVNLFFN